MLELETIELPEEIHVSDAARRKKQKTLRHRFRNSTDRVPAHRHVNGGGWVSNTAIVEDSVYVGPQAEVGGTAIVVGRVEIKGRAGVYDRAQISGTVVIQKKAVVKNKAQVSGDGVVSGTCCVSGGALVAGTFELNGSVEVKGSAKIIDSLILGWGTISEDTQVTKTSLRGVFHITGRSDIYASYIRGTISVRNSIISCSTVDLARSTYGYYKGYNLPPLSSDICHDMLNNPWSAQISGNNRLEFDNYVVSLGANSVSDITALFHPSLVHWRLLCHPHSVIFRSDIYAPVVLQRNSCLLGITMQQQSINDFGETADHLKLTRLFSDVDTIHCRLTVEKEIAQKTGLFKTPKSTPTPLSVVGLAGQWTTAIPVAFDVPERAILNNSSGVQTVAELNGSVLVRRGDTAAQNTETGRASSSSQYTRAAVPIGDPRGRRVLGE